MTLKGNTQTLNSTPIPDHDLQKVLKAAKTGRIAQRELLICKQRVDLLEFRIITKDSIIATYQQFRINDSLMIDSQKKENALYQKKDELAQVEIKGLKKDVKRERRKKWYIGIGAFLIGIGISTLVK